MGPPRNWRCEETSAWRAAGADAGASGSPSHAAVELCGVNRACRPRGAEGARMRERRTGKSHLDIIKDGESLLNVGTDQGSRARGRALASSASSKSSTSASCGTGQSTCRASY